MILLLILSRELTYITNLKTNAVIEILIEIIGELDHYFLLPSKATTTAHRKMDKAVDVGEWKLHTSHPLFCADKPNILWYGSNLAEFIIHNIGFYSLPPGSEIIEGFATSLTLLQDIAKGTNLMEYIASQLICGAE